MEFVDYSVPAMGGPEDGKGIECKGMKLDDGIAWPAGMWTPDGYYYALEFDENDMPSQFRYDKSRNKPRAQTKD